MYINEDTKISVLVKYNIESINAITSISKNFDKLKIPILRKVLASRVTIKQAAKIGGTDIQTFYDKLKPLGFIVKEEKSQTQDIIKAIPEFYLHLNSDKVNDLDVRITLKEGKDPFNDIMTALEKLPNEFTLKIINTFEPTPLISILSKKGYEHHTINVGKALFYTYFKKNTLSTPTKKITTNTNENSEMQDILEQFNGKIEKIDVRALEMPLPMSTILNTLATLNDDKLLYVHHKKVPQFLFPELAERGYKWYIHEIEEGDVKLLIYK